MRQAFSLPEDLHLLKHPFYQAWMSGRLSRAALADYAEQYYRHVAAFPGYLIHALELTHDADARQILSENLAEEDGTTFGTPHPELWLRFAEGLGVSRATAQHSAPRAGIQGVVDTFTRFSKKSFHEALGALYAYEAQVPEVAASKIEGLKAHFDIHDESTLSFFEVHRVADVAHRESLLGLLEKLTPGEKAEAEYAARAACEALWAFLTDVFEADQRVSA